MALLSTSEHLRAFLEESLRLCAAAWPQPLTGVHPSGKTNRIDSFVCVHKSGRKQSQKFHSNWVFCPSAEWGNVAWWLLHLAKVMLWRWQTVGTYDSLTFLFLHPFLLEIKQVFLARSLLKRPAVHDWRADICQFLLCRSFKPRSTWPVVDICRDVLFFIKRGT